jgi:hypothetical protein
VLIQVCISAKLYFILLLQPYLGNFNSPFTL